MEEKRVITIALSRSIREQYKQLREKGIRDADIFKAGLTYLVKKDQLEKEITETTNNMRELVTSLTTASNLLSKLLEQFVSLVGKLTLFSEKVEKASQYLEKINNVADKLDVHDRTLLAIIEELKKSQQQQVNKEYTKEQLINQYTAFIEVLKQKGVYSLVAEDLAKKQNEILRSLNLTEIIKEDQREDQEFNKLLKSLEEETKK